MSFQNTIKCMNKLKVEPVECINEGSEWSNEIQQLNKVIEEMRDSSSEPLSLFPEAEIHSQRSLSFAQGVSNIETIRKKQAELKSKMNDTKPKKPMKPKKVIISNIANTKTK